jgi:hypothetical protein
MMSQLIAIIKYELIMQWRRRGLLVLFAASVTGSLGILLLMSGSGASSPLISVDTQVFLLTTIAGNIIAAGIPVIAAEAIPLDRVYHMDDILHSTSVSHLTYLLGKLVSVELIVAGGMIVSAVVMGVVIYSVFGAFSLPLYSMVWLVGILPMALVGAGLGVLLAVGCNTRRSALMVGLGVMVYCIALYELSFVLPTVAQQPITVIPVGAVNLVIAVLLAWGWLRWQEARA